MNKYKNSIISGIKYSLSVKFQMSENIKTSKQLYPVFICYFIKNINFPIVIILIYLQVPNYIISLTFIYTTMSASILNGIIEYIIITHHSTLKKNLIKIIYKIEFKKSNRINIVEENANIPTTINGSNLINNDEMEKHFTMLKDAWK
uniref:Uncharacterized protein n=1 Tax=Meloidogyne enterolobii TaxID=390850 RepID=A0A6V7VBK3_MELEN|nr:unnamed protein product [Meloidogyne enterolobii]